MAVARIYIVRHGETDANRQGIIQGQLDTELNAGGIEQAQLTANALENVPFTAAFSSDLRRAVKTAEIILEGHPGVQLEQTAALRERYMGALQGLAYHARHTLGAAASIDWERPDAFAARTVKWWNTAILGHASRLGREDAQTPLCVLVTTHGGVIGILIETLLGSRKLRCDNGVVITRCFNASITVIELDEKGKGTLISYADTTHLDVDFVHTNVDVQL